MIGWYAATITLIGLILNAQKVRASWLLWVLGNWLWIVHGFQMHDPAVIWLNIVFVFVNLYGFYQWRPKNAAPEAQTETVYLVEHPAFYPLVEVSAAYPHHAQLRDQPRRERRVPLGDGGPAVEVLVHGDGTLRPESEDKGGGTEADRGVPQDRRNRTF